MKVLWCVVSLILLVEAAPERRIFGGYDALAGELPYQVSIQRAILTTRTHVCGGSILNQMHVLTAASCFWTDSSSRFEVVAGNLRIDQASETQQLLTVNWIRMHPEYNGGPSSSDLAIVRTSSAFFYNHVVRPITLPPADQLPSGVVRIGGWGSSTTSILPGNNFSNMLQKISVPIVDWNECYAVLGGAEGPLDERNMCTGPLTGGISTCTGDAGGAAVQQQGIDVYLQVGVISWNLVPCAAINTPSIYTRVSAFIDWIQANSVL
ncbi:trypsin-1-like [Anopheles bellator]|uniref:trypsin-1-like n=1 Tax=Anopheles bellator TaxID=139047 RepID=UPI002648B913|nr:trypsin-1-like [Anopheles bellator]